MPEIAAPVDIDHVDETEPQAAAPAAVEGHEPTLVEADLLVEDVSIDGMCGVY